MPIRRFRIHRKAAGEKVAKRDAQFYYKEGKSLVKRNPKKAIEHLQKAAELNSSLAEEDEFKQSMFDASMVLAGEAGKVKRRDAVSTIVLGGLLLTLTFLFPMAAWLMGFTWLAGGGLIVVGGVIMFRSRRSALERLDAEVKALNEVMQYAYNDVTKADVRKKLIRANEDLLRVTETAFDKKNGEAVRKKHKTDKELNAARTAALLKLGQIYSESFDRSDLNEAVKYYDQVLNIQGEGKNAEAVKGKENAEMLIRAVQIARTDSKTVDEENKNEYLAKAYSQRAKDARRRAEAAKQAGKDEEAAKYTSEEEKDLIEATGLTPEDTGAYIRLAEIYQEKNDVESLQGILTKAVQAAEGIKDETAREQFIDDMQSELDALDVPGGIMDGVLDFIVTLDMQGVAALPADKQKAKQEELRRRLSQKADGDIQFRLAFKRYYARSQGKDDTLSPGQTEEVQVAVESLVNQSGPALKLDTSPMGIEAFIKKGEALLSEGRLDDLERFVELGISQGLRDQRIYHLRVKRMIAQADVLRRDKADNWRSKVKVIEDQIDSNIEKKLTREAEKIEARVEYTRYLRAKAREIISERKAGWEQEAAAVETKIAKRTHAIEDREIRSKPELEFAEYYAYKMGYLKGAAAKTAAKDRKKYYRMALEDAPFSMEALKKLASIKGTEAEVIKHIADVLAKPGLADQDAAFKKELLAFVESNLKKWEKAKEKAKDAGEKASLTFDFPQDITNFGAMPLDLAVRFVDFAFKTKNFGLLSGILNQKYETAGEYMDLMDAVLRNMASKSPAEFEELKDIDFNIFMNVQSKIDPRKCRTIEKSMLESKIWMARAYIHVARGEESLCSYSLGVVERANPYMTSAIGLVRIKLRMVQGELFRFPSSFWRATRKLSAEDKKTAQKDLTSILKE